MTVAESRIARNISALTSNVGVWISIVVLALFALAAVFAPWITSHDPLAQDLLSRLTPPVWDPQGSWEHPLGTDQLGRDYLTRLVYGSRICLFIGVSVAFVSAVIGSALGVIGGYFEGTVDAVVSFLINVRLALPVILVSLASVAVFGASMHVLILVLGLLLWDRFALVIRSTTRQVARNDYVDASRSMGISNGRIIFIDVLPNLWANILVLLPIEIAHAIILEAALSFLGLGTPPPTPSWGLMISEAKSSMMFHPWLITIPGVLLLVLVTCITVVGEQLRKLNNQRGQR